MNENRSGLRRTLKCLSLFSLTLVLTSVLFAKDGRCEGESSAPGMYGIKEVILKVARFGDPKTSKTCGLSGEAITDLLRTSLQANGIPALIDSEAPPTNIGIGRLYIIPEVYSYNTETFDCISWISLAAEGHSRLRVPPIDLSRDITISYWRQGSLLSGNQGNYSNQVADGFKKLSEAFADQFKLDQPPNPGGL